MSRTDTSGLQLPPAEPSSGPATLMDTPDIAQLGGDNMDSDELMPSIQQVRTLAASPVAFAGHAYSLKY